MELTAGMVRRQKGLLTKRTVDLDGIGEAHRETVAKVIAQGREDLGYHRSIQLDIRDPSAPMEPWEKMRRFT